MKNEEKIKELKKIVNLHFDIDIANHIQTTKYVTARNIYYKLCKMLDTKITVTEIAKTVNRIPSTVTIALQSFDDKIAYDAQFKKEYETFLIQNTNYLEYYFNDQVDYKSKIVLIKLTKILTKLNSKNTLELLYLLNTVAKDFEKKIPNC